MRPAYFHVTVTGDFARFHCFNCKTGFLKIEKLFSKTGVSFLVESTNIESVTFPCKTYLSKSNVKTNRI